MAPEAPRVQGLLPGQLVDGFELLECLHYGGMAALWRVTRAGLTVPAIMKIPLLGDDPAAIVGFEVEQMILPLLQGPHVPRLIAAGGFEAQPYIVMEMLQGQSLRARLEHAPLPTDEVAAIGARVAEALNDLHQQQVIHHDLKPSNIMFREDGTAVLIDLAWRATIVCRICWPSNFACPWARVRIYRPNKCCTTVPIPAATCSRWA